jgi:hypothetical protein
MQLLSQLIEFAKRIRTFLGVFVFLILAGLVLFKLSFSQGAFDPLIDNLAILDKDQLFILAMATLIMFSIITLIGLILSFLSAPALPQQTASPSSAWAKEGEIRHKLSQLRHEAQNAFLVCSRYDPLPPLDIWNSVSGEEWFSTKYFGSGITPIMTYFHALEEYAELPRLRGSGPRIEGWMQSTDLNELYQGAKVAFRTLLEDE